jgi:hypothetical protein
MNELLRAGNDSRENFMNLSRGSSDGTWKQQQNEIKNVEFMQTGQKSRQQGC